MGLRTIALAAKPGVQFSWRGKQVTGDDIVVFPRGAELSSVSDPHFHVFTCSVPDDLLARTAEAYGVGEYAFSARYGMTPKGFLIAFRLNAVRRGLRAANSTSEGVADIANRWGFWHMGQFAADYRKQFGELPSQTLRRVDG